MARTQTVCRYYLRGICGFGEFCRFSHDLSSGQLVKLEHNDNPNEKDELPIASTSSCGRQSIWANAPVFVPRYKWNSDSNSNPDTKTKQQRNLHSEICPFGAPCIWGDHCPYPVHLELCEICDLFCLHPADLEQREVHKRECREQQAKALDLTCAIARSKDKTCGICFDTIVDKEDRKCRFGILPQCRHTFCLDCIRRWRRAKQFAQTVTRSCPECRVYSAFVCPSLFWVETKEDKDKLIQGYRTALAEKDCKYFRKGEGRCPFGNKCFYRHATESGILIDVGSPRQGRKPPSPNEDGIDLLDDYQWEDFITSMTFVGSRFC
ncbi:probable E3 ubiquitin-protein ligase makorin-1 [Drosophila ficusphila]|uniref:probable E3 ubiquitin-protein ligase makorin-1 n=1 Tax=Drosophila ficusphila TaxID=30025 RepID=UPI0007E7E32B|nr:probable E3 ubiquitin-protein ligase makorin-1 [Drosophila ficusphila]